MSDAVEFKKGATLDERCRYITDKAAYYYNKIQTYDGICNEFSTLKSNLDSIIEDSKESIRICNLLKTRIEDQESSINQSHQRTTEESEISNQKFYSLIKQLEELRAEMRSLASFSNEKIELMNSSLRSCMQDYVHNDYWFTYCTHIESSLDEVKDLYNESKIATTSIKEEVGVLHEKNHQTCSRLDSLHKDICRLQNSIVFNHSEVMKRINEINK